MEVKLITLNEYQELVEERSTYNRLMKYADVYVDPVDHFKIGDMMELEMGTIKDMQHHYEKGITFNDKLEFLSYITKKDLKYFGTQQLNKITQTFSYFDKGISKILELEKMNLAHNQTAVEEQAGIGLFKGLGTSLQIYHLAKGDILKESEIRKLSYGKCFQHMLINKRLADYNIKLNELSKQRK
ncbi:MAG: hypothetical protein OEL54_03050 [Flavobacteriaceae bacterium]|nr:hypothetical protein [Flavobacteriaceae bacterium]